MPLCIWVDCDEVLSETLDELLKLSPLKEKWIKKSDITSYEIYEVEKNNIVENHLIKNPGDEIKAFTGANTTLGILLMKFDSLEQMLHMMDHSEEWIKVILK